MDFRIRSRRSAWMGTLVGVAALGFSSMAQADSCDDWRDEHADWKAKALAMRLRNAPQPETDRVMFEMLQREAYLSSCDLPSAVVRGDLVGWRLVERDRLDLSDAVLDSVLERAGFELDLATRIANAGVARAAGRRRRILSVSSDGGVKSQVVYVQEGRP